MILQNAREYLANEDPTWVELPVCFLKLSREHKYPTRLFRIRLTSGDRKELKLMMLSFIVLTAIVATAYAQNSSSVVPLSGNHSAATLPFWPGYTYCQGKIISPSTWQPMPNASLIKLQVMHRHGARSPATLVPGDNTPWYQCGYPDEFVFMNLGNVLAAGRSPYMKEEEIIDGPWNHTFWKGNCDAGELTTLGSNRMNQVGQVLRSVYVDKAKFLPVSMDSSFGVRHTYIWRTRESVENLFAGLYPIQTRSANQTLRMTVKPSVIETMLTNTAACPRLAYLTSAYANSSAYAATLAPYTALQMKYVAAYNTSSVKGFNTTQALYDTASAEYCHGLGLKGNLTGADIQTGVIPGTSAYHNIFRSNSNPNATEVKQLDVGPLISEILASFEDRSTLLQVYSAHDASLDMFLAVVADPDLPWPPFSSSVAIELWQQSQGGMAVRMFYEGMVVPANPELKCSFEACPLRVLQESLRRFVVVDLGRACTV